MLVGRLLVRFFVYLINKIAIGGAVTCLVLAVASYSEGNSYASIAFVVISIVCILVWWIMRFFGEITGYNARVQAKEARREQRAKEWNREWDTRQERERQEEEEKRRKREEEREREEERKREEEERRLEKERDQPLYDYTLNHVVGRVKLDRNGYVSSFTLFSFSMFHSRQRISEADIQYAYGKYYIPQKFFEYD